MPWPDLTLSNWEDTRDTLHMWLQVVGKVRLALAPMLNHWWQVTFYVSARGRTTGLMPTGGRGLEIEFDPAAANRFWIGLVNAHRVMTEFRGRFIGKASPVHFFWGGPDLAVTRFSGRTAPQHPGGVPNCADWVQVLAYSHEVSSCGFWPGGGGEGMFYSYAYPEPPGFADRPVEPGGAYYDATFHEFLLPYGVVRGADDSDAVLMAFLQSTYEAAADLGAWPRTQLEAPS